MSKTGSLSTLKPIVQDKSIKHTDLEPLKVQKLSQSKKSRSIEDLDIIEDKNDPECYEKAMLLTEWIMEDKLSPDAMVEKLQSVLKHIGKGHLILNRTLLEKQIG